MQPEVLNPAGLREVFMALAFETTVRGVLLRGEKVEQRPSEETTLRAARDALERGEADGAQIHYIHDSVDASGRPVREEWWDTVMRTEAGFRRVRIRKAAGGR
jgi:hypothetical protein